MVSPKSSLAVSLALVVFVCLVGTSATAMLIVERGATGTFELSPGQQALLRTQLLASLGLISLASLLMTLAVIRRMLAPVRQLAVALESAAPGQPQPQIPQNLPGRELQHLADATRRMLQQTALASANAKDAETALARRAQSVDRLLEFSQTVQGAGQSEQVYTALAHYLERELGLAGIAILTYEADAVPAVQVRAVQPSAIANPQSPLADLDVTLCPCLRQNLAKQFAPDNSPIRCAIDRSLLLPVTAPAYCIPFHIGSSIQGVAHMALPEKQQWDEQRRALAQTYVNAAVSSLISLHLLEQAEKQSLTDSLTGLYNRHSMERLLQREVALAERHHHAMSLVMIDLDHFKQVNDVHGHAAGDHMLRALADCVRMTLRKTDLAFRYGGDELVIALPQTQLAQAQQVVQKLRQAFAAVDFSHAITGLDRPPTLSIGVAQRAAPHTLALPALLAAADQALYDAKAANRNCVRIYQPPEAA